MEKKIPRMLTIKAASEETGISYDAIRKMILRKKIVFIKCGAKYLVNMDRFIDYLNGQETAGNGSAGLEQVS